MPKTSGSWIKSRPKYATSARTCGTTTGPGRALIIEEPYVDRHYLEEFTGYYASALTPPPSKTTRIHILSEALDESGFLALVRNAASGGYARSCKTLQDMYLGYIVVRLIPSAPIGRTVLAPYSSAGARCFEPATTAHHVHLAGLHLKVQGVPFQQQDQAVGACATTAIWSAISRVARADGSRPPTPLAITLVATRHLLSDRQLPATTGLDLNQTLAAIRESGFSPWVLKPEGEHDVFKLAVKCCVRSGIPVILQLRDQDDRSLHAVTVVGFREDDDEEPEGDLRIPLGDGSFVLRSSGMSRIYVHDDRLGPYARMVWQKSQTPPDDPTLRFLSRETGWRTFESPSWVSNAIVPLYPKLRLTPSDLIGLATQQLPLMRSLAGEAGRDDLKVDLRFVHGGRYLEGVLVMGLSSDRAAEIATTAELSRYVGVIRFSIGADWLADIVCDTTDIRRDAPGPWLLAIPRDPAHVPAMSSNLAPARVR